LVRPSKRRILRGQPSLKLGKKGALFNLRKGKELAGIRNFLGAKGNNFPLLGFKLFRVFPLNWRRTKGGREGFLKFKV